MSQWRITRGDQQFVAKDVAELKLWAAGGKIKAEDLVQKPGSTTWNYAIELDELDGLIKFVPPEDYRPNGPGIGRILRPIAIGLTALVLIGGFVVLNYVRNNMPDPAALRVEIEAFNGMLTEDADLLDNYQDGRALASLPKDSQVTLVRKVGEHYQVETADGTTGWLNQASLVPGYYFDASKRAQWDPIFNPDSYLEMVNYGWQAANDPTLPPDLTWFTFAVRNSCDYNIGEVILEITLANEDQEEFGVWHYKIPEVVPPQRTLFMDQLELNIDYKNNPNATVRVIGGRVLQGDELQAAIDASIEVIEGELVQVSGEGMEEDEEG